MFVLIGGGGRTGTQVALLLLAQHHEVRLIENRSDVLARLHRELPSECIYEGSVTDPQVLALAGIGNADVVAACTSSDADNLTLCYFARAHYNVRRTIARINDPRNAWLFDSTFHVDVNVNHSELLGGLIMEEMSLGDMVTLLKLRRGQFLLVEERIPPRSKAAGVTVMDLKLPDSCVIAAIIRNEEVVVPRGGTIFQEGDEVLAVTDQAGAVRLAEILAPAA